MKKSMQPEVLHKVAVNGRPLYSPVIVVEGRHSIFIAGQLAPDRNGNVVGKGDMSAQIRQVCLNLKAALEAAGATVNDLVRTNTYVTDIGEFFKHVDVRTEFFGPVPPTSSTVEVRRLSTPDFLIEIDAIAVIDRRTRAATRHGQKPPVRQQ